MPLEPQPQCLQSSPPFLPGWRPGHLPPPPHLVSAHGRLSLKSSFRPPFFSILMTTVLDQAIVVITHQACCRNLPTGLPAASLSFDGQPPCWSWSDLSRMLSYHVLFLLKTLWTLPTALRMNPTSLAGLAGPPRGLALLSHLITVPGIPFAVGPLPMLSSWPGVPSSRSTFLHAGDSCSPSLIPHGCCPLQGAFNLCSLLKSCLLNHPQAWGSCPNSVLPQNPEHITC